MGHEVLVLNHNYEPLNVCTMRRAIALQLCDKVDVLHHRETPILTGSSVVPAPSVLKMRYLVRRPMPQLRLSRHSVLARDSYTCQYCGGKGRELTIDHVIPRWAGGGHDWDNVVACCRRCNLKKGDKTPHQAQMQLVKRPRRPRFIPYLSLPLYMKAMLRSDWRDYLPVFEELLLESAIA